MDALLTHGPEMLHKEMFHMSHAKDAYRDIFDAPRPVSTRPKPMSRMERAAQFAPFAALSGYDALIAEAGRATEAARCLEEDRREELDRALRALLARTPPPEAAFTWFVPDPKKPGGSAVTAVGRLVRYDAQTRLLRLDSGAEIPLDALLAVDGVELPET